MKCIIRDFPISINDIPYKKPYRYEFNLGKPKQVLVS